MNLIINHSTVEVFPPPSGTVSDVHLIVTDTNEFLALRERYAPQESLAPGYDGRPRIYYQRYGIRFGVTGPEEAAIEPAPEDEPALEAQAA